MEVGEDKCGHESESCTWKVFKAAFYEKYFPKSDRFQCYWFCAVPVRTSGIFRIGMLTGMRIPHVPHWIRFRPIYSGYFGQFWPIQDFDWKKKKKNFPTSSFWVSCFSSSSSSFFLSFFFFFWFWSTTWLPLLLYLCVLNCPPLVFRL